MITLALLLFSILCFLIIFLLGGGLVAIDIAVAVLIVYSIVKLIVKK